MNTALVTVMVNLQPPVTLPTPVNLAFHGTVSLVGRDWHSSVGPSIVIAMVTNLVSQVVKYILVFQLSRLKRKSALLASVSQQQLNRRFQAAELKVTERISDLLTVVFVCFMYASALPPLIPIAAIHFMVRYWMDKVRWSRVAPRRTRLCHPLWYFHCLCWTRSTRVLCSSFPYLSVRVYACHSSSIA